MEVAWVLSEDYADPIVKSETIKDIGTTWGSWKTWRSWSTDNVLCADNTKAQDLIKRAAGLHRRQMRRRTSGTSMS